MKESVSTIFTFLFLGLLLVSLGCNKETLDLESDTYFNIKELLRSENCDATCGEVADCEGQELRIRGQLDESNLEQDIQQFYLIDDNDNDFRLEISVDAVINSSVYQKLSGNGGRVFRVEGEMQGYDAPTNATCNRMFNIQLRDPSKVNLE